MEKKVKFRRFIDQADEQDCTFYPSMNQVTRAYNIINHCIFNDQLTKPPIYFRRLRDAWGLCNGHLIDESNLEPQCNSIILRDRFPSKRRFIEVLAHEMVHQYQVEYLNRMDHGQTFWAWKDKFEKYNLRLWHSAR